jgi:fructose-bisphosphate aldolase class I
MNASALAETIGRLLAPGKGLLAADESTGTITRRFQALGIPSTSDTRRDYRHLLFTTPGIAEHLGGVILYDETIRQVAADGRPLREVLASQGIAPGIKVDTGAMELALHPGERITEGLDGLRPRLAEYYALGARFAKWRAVIAIGVGLPTAFGLAANARAMARYAALCQEAALVPIVEPEVLMDGAHSLARCEEVTTAALSATFAALAEHGVLLEGVLLKPNMVLAGQCAAEQSSPEAVVEATLRTLRRTVPAAVPGVVFLSGGQSPERATAHLNLLNRAGAAPWALSFSFARALQGPAMEAWRGAAANVPAAQRAFAARVRLAGAARRGAYDPAMEAAA